MAERTITTEPDIAGDFLKIEHLGILRNGERFFLVSTKFLHDPEPTVEIRAKDALRIVQFFLSHIIDERSER